MFLSGEDLNLRARGELGRTTVRTGGGGSDEMTDRNINREHDVETDIPTGAPINDRLPIYPGIGSQERQAGDVRHDLRVDTIDGIG